VSGFAFVVVDLFVPLSVAVRSRLRELTAANPKNLGAFQNLVEVGNLVEAESLAEVEPLRLELPATVSHLPLNPLSEIEGVFVVAVDLVEQDQFVKVAGVVGSRVVERPVEWDEVEMAETVVVVAENQVVHRAVLGESVMVVEVAESRVAEVAQIPAVDHLVEGERKVAEVEPLSVESVELVVAPLQVVVAAVFRPDTSKLRQSPAPSKCRPVLPEVAPAWQC
jgi:hypothetical protein